jgi:hypothetical protein
VLLYAGFPSSFILRVFFLSRAAERKDKTTQRKDAPAVQMPAAQHAIPPAFARLP